MVKCTQCNRDAFYEINGHPLCVDHAASVRTQKTEEMRHLAMLYNLASDQADAVVGMPGLSPRMEIPPPTTQIVRKGDMNTYNNINVDRSVVGAINTGSIDNIDVSLSQINNSGESLISKTLAEFTEEVFENKEIEDDKKTKLLEMIEVISAQVALPPDQRKKNLFKLAWDTITSEATNVTKIAAAWEKVSSIITG